MDSSTVAAFFLVLTSFVPFTNQEIRHDNCVTWEDDLTTVTITCRLQNLVQPVKISSKRTGITINCSKINDKSVCSHKNSSVMFYDNKTVAIQIVVIKNKDLTDDRWECSQGLEKLFTNVSYIDGIKSDSWLNIRGKKHTDNNNTDIIVECGSCRVPDYNYLEFHINKMSNGSMVYNKDKGTCTYKRNQCQPFMCNCSSVGNWYQLRLRLTNEIKEIACSGHFKDTLREGKLSITSNLIITGEEIIYGDSIKEMIVQNKKLFFPNAEKDNVSVSTDAPVDRENEDRRKNVTWIIVGSVVGPVILIVAVVISIYSWLLRRNNEKRKSGNIKLKDVGFTEEKNVIKNDNNIEEQEARENTSLLGQNERKSTCGSGESESTEDGYGSCHSCKSSTSRYRCLPCDEILCKNCASKHRESIATRLHPVSLIKDVPKGLSLSRYCKVHMIEENTLCADHNTIICEECSMNDHKSCKANVFDGSCHKENLIKFDSFLDQRLNEISAMTSFLTAGIKLLQNNFDCISSMIEKLESLLMKQKGANNMEMVENIIADCRKELQLIYNKQVALCEQKIDGIQQLCSQLEELKSNLDFIKGLESRRTEFLFVYSIRSKSKCDRIKTTIKEISPELCRYRLEFCWTLSKSSLGRFQINVDDYYEKRNPKRTVSQTPRPFYRIQTLRSFNCDYDNVQCVGANVLVLTTSKVKSLLIYNIKEKEERNISLDCLPFDIAIAGSFTAIVTCYCKNAVIIVNLTNDSCRKKKIQDSAKGSVATSESFILLALNGMQIISIFTHDLTHVYNIKTPDSVERLTAIDNTIAFISSNSVYVIDVQGEMLSQCKNNEKPKDIISTNAGTILILEDSPKIIRQFTKNSRELEFKFDSSNLRSVSGFCFDKKSSDIFILSKDGSTSVLNMLCMS